MSHDVKLGQILNGTEKRDAIHVAIAPVIAEATLRPGEPIGFTDAGDSEKVGGADKFSKIKQVGIVDPFLKAPVKRGQRFYMFLLPNTVTGMRHEWIHPAFEEQEAEKVLAGINRLDNTPSVQWLTQHAKEFEISYEELIEGGKVFLANGDMICLGFDTPTAAYEEAGTFWKHFEIVTGIKVPDDQKAENIFRCAC